MAKALESKAIRALRRSESVRTTVPSAICSLLGIEPGDTLVWTPDVKTGAASVRKAVPGGEKMPGKKSSRP